MDPSTLPKIELHVHLDCSLSYQAAQKISPDLSLSEYRQKLIGPPKCKNLAHYLECAQFSVNLLQTKSSLRIAVDDLLRQQKRDLVIYSEIRFAPYEHVKKGLSPEEVVDTVLEEMKIAGLTYGIKTNLILCTLRHYPREYSMHTAELVLRYAGSGVVGFDIASDEANFPLDNHVEAFEMVKKQGIPVTAHAGEAAGADSIWETLDKIQPSRIGHGVRSYEDVKLLRHLAGKKIHLEVCPSSNIQTDVFDHYSNHRISTLLEAGISISLNSDARTITDIDLNQEYSKIGRHFEWDTATFYNCNIEAIKHAFINKDEKKALLDRLDASISK